MKQRNIAAVMALSFFTFGIHTLYWLKVTRDEMVERGASIPKFWILVALSAVDVVLAVVLLVALAAIGVSENSTASNLSPVIAIGGAFFLFLIYAATVAVGIYWLYRYSQGVELVTKGQTSFGLTFGLGLALTLFGFWFIWPGIVQDGFNKVKNAAPKPKKVAAKA